MTQEFDARAASGNGRLDARSDAAHVFDVIVDAAADLKNRANRFNCMCMYDRMLAIGIELMTHREGPGSRPESDFRRMLLEQSHLEALHARLHIVASSCSSQVTHQGAASRSSTSRSSRRPAWLDSQLEGLNGEEIERGKPRGKK